MVVADRTAEAWELVQAVHEVIHNWHTDYRPEFGALSEMQGLKGSQGGA
jgi:hypothetical protein